MAFREISVEELKDNPFTLINKDWMLITAGNREKHNTMTASWGGVGELWGRYVSTIYIRPQRYTLEFVEREDYYSLCFFGPDCRQALNLCGSKSGREVDKDAATGLTPCFAPHVYWGNCEGAGEGVSPYSASQRHAKRTSWQNRDVLF